MGMTASMKQRTDTGITTEWKRRRPALKRGLTVVAACFILLAVAPAVSTAMVVTSSSSCNGTDCAAAGVGGVSKQSQEVRNVSEHGGNGKTCFTAACNDTATMILNNMDRSVDPCDNFYMYACGGYLNSTKIPDGEDFEDYYSSTERKVYKQLRAIVEAEIEPNEPKAYKLVKKYYKSCMNESAIEARGVQPLLADLRRIGGWPMIEGASWNESNFEWTKAIYELRNSGHTFDNFIHFHVDESKINHTEYAIYISPPERTLYYNSGYNQLVRPRSELMLYIAITLGAQNNTGTEEELEETMKFASDLLMIPKSETTINNTAAIPMTLTELKMNYPNIPWQEYICAMMPSTVSIPKNEVMILETPIYFTRLDKLMSNTSNRVLANYIAQTTALASTIYVSEKQQSLAAPEGNTVASAKWKMCIESVCSLSFALESMYVNRHLSADTKKDVVSIMDDVSKAIRKILETTNWLDQIAKSQALRKFDALRGFIAHADQLSDDKLDKIYEKLEMDEEKYYENVHKISLFNTEYSLGKLRQPVDKRSLIESLKITEVDGEYSPFENSVALTVGMLQDNFFSKDRPRYMNYGAIGTAIGHEIIHALDNAHRHLNEEGKIIDWWQPSSKNEFFKRVRCLVHQYSNYIVREVGLHVNGALTVSENIADNGGIKGAYLAYSNWVAKNGEEPKLPGIDMTPNQLFWMSAANAKCKKSTPNHLIFTINIDEHSPREFQIIGSMSNVPQFATDFTCPPGSKMNPTEKCSIW